MIATSPDGTYIAVTHWGNNTVGILNIADEFPEEWSQDTCYVIDHKLELNFSLTSKVDRDSNSGYCLRGTFFTPDCRYLLVGCMGGGGGIAVIDLQKREYMGRVLGMMSNVRHIIQSGEWLYLSINTAGYVQRIKLKDFMAAAEEMRSSGKRTITLKGWESCDTPAGTRTIVASPDGKYIFAACNYSSCLAVINTADMTLVGTLKADSFPVGLDISDDGRHLLLSSQAHGGGGNAVDIFSIIYKGCEMDTISSKIATARVAEMLIDEAKKYLGAKYRHASGGPDQFDCSGFCSFIYGKFGYSLSPSSKIQATEGREVIGGIDRLQKGDILVFGSRNNTGEIGHVGIFIEPDSTGTSFKFIHAARTGVIISELKESYYTKRYMGARRFLPDFKMPDRSLMETDGKQLPDMEEPEMMKKAGIIK